MSHFTKYANQKFDILNTHKVYFTREQVEDAVKTPEKVVKKSKYSTAYKDGVGVVYRSENGKNMIITFYPVKDE